jgi:energy-coupling factor transporter ATP-binding protein EcfA2
VTQTAEVLGLTPYLDRMPKQLSGGQRQRVAMGRAIVRNPAVFLLDEPLSNLDAALRVQMRAEIRGLHERLGSTSVFVTHDQVEAMTMADRIVVMRAGRFEQAGAPLDLYGHPVNVFVAGFIGPPAMNLLRGVAENGWVNVGSDQTLLLDKPASGDVIYGIRPERRDPVPAGSADAISGAVTVVERTGTATFVAVQADALHLTDKSMPIEQQLAQYGYDGFLPGVAAMGASGHWSVPEYSTVAFKWDVAPIPQGPAGRATGMNSAGFVIAKDSKNPDAGQAELAKIGLAIQMREAVASSPANPEQATKIDHSLFVKTLDYARVKPVFRGYEEWSAAFGDALNLIWTEELSVEDGLAEAVAGGDDALARNK